MMKGAFGDAQEARESRLRQLGGESRPGVGGLDDLIAANDGHAPETPRLEVVYRLQQLLIQVALGITLPQLFFSQSRHDRRSL